MNGNNGLSNGRRFSGKLATILLLALFSCGMYWTTQFVQPGFLAGIEYFLAGLAGQYLLLFLCIWRIAARAGKNSTGERALRLAACVCAVWLAAALPAVFVLQKEGFATVFFWSLFPLTGLAGGLLFAPLAGNTETRALRYATGAALLALGILIPLTVKF